MITAELLLLVLDLLGTFAFALNGALTATRAIRLDVVGVFALGAVTAVGGGVVRDLIIGAVPPATFIDWRYLAFAFLGALIAFLVGQRLERLAGLILVLDAIGLGLFAVTGASKAMAAGLGPLQSVLLGVITAVGGGTIRDMMMQRVPTVLTSDLYAIPALLGATVTVVAITAGWYGPVLAIAAAVACIVLRLLGAHFGWNAPRPLNRPH